MLHSACSLSYTTRHIRHTTYKDSYLNTLVQLGFRTVWVLLGEEYISKNKNKAKTNSLEEARLQSFFFLQNMQDVRCGLSNFTKGYTLHPVWSFIVWDAYSLIINLHKLCFWTPSFGTLITRQLVDQHPVITLQSPIVDCGLPYPKHDPPHNRTVFITPACVGYLAIQHSIILKYITAAKAVRYCGP